jgi:hypothetical protein
MSKTKREKKVVCPNEGCDKRFTTAYCCNMHSKSSSCKYFEGEEERVECPRGCGETFRGMSRKQNAIEHSKTIMCKNHPDRKPDHKTTNQHKINEDGTKYCNDCKIYKPINEFAEKNNVKNNTGRDYVCYECRALWAMYISVKRKAKEEGNDLAEITKEYFWSLKVKKCPVFDINLQYGGDEQCNNSATVDAIIHSEGHKKGNLQIISKRANTIKNNSTLSEMKALCEAIEKWQAPKIEEVERKRKAGKKTNEGQDCKVCSLCQKEKKIDDFHKSQGTKAGIANRCIRCSALSSMIKNAKTRDKFKVDIDAWYLYQLTKDLVECPVLGCELLFGGTGTIKDNSASIDRFDPTKGYTRDNVWIISDKANRMKSDATLEEIKRVYAYMELASQNIDNA